MPKLTVRTIKGSNVLDVELYKDDNNPIGRIQTDKVLSLNISTDTCLSLIPQLETYFYDFDDEDSAEIKRLKKKIRRLKNENQRLLNQMK